MTKTAPKRHVGLLNGLNLDPELDYFEYTSNILAQAAYISSDLLMSNADIDNEDMSDITDWTDGDGGDAVSSQVTFDNKTCMKHDSGGAGNYTYRYKTITAFGTRTVISINTYCAAIGTLANTDNLRLVVQGAAYRLHISFASNGLFISDGVTNNQVGSGLVVQGVWQKWTFDINWTTARVDVYLDGILKASAVDCSYEDVSGNGIIRIIQYGTTTANRISYIDLFKAGSDLIIPLQCYSEATIKIQGSYSLKCIALLSFLYATLTRTVTPTIDLSGMNIWRFFIYSSRTGSNIKVSIHNSNGATTESTPNITSAGTWQEVVIDLTAVADADKNAIDKIFITLVNTDANNTFYIDNMYAEYVSSLVSYRAQKGLISGYHCFMKQYIDFTKASLAPLKLPDGTLW